MSVCLSVPVRVLESVLGTGRWWVMYRAFDRLKKPPQMFWIQLLPCLLSVKTSNLGFAIGKLYTILNPMWHQYIENH